MINRADIHNIVVMSDLTAFPDGQRTAEKLRGADMLLPITRSDATLIVNALHTSAAMQKTLTVSKDDIYERGQNSALALAAKIIAGLE